MGKIKKVLPKGYLPTLKSDRLLSALMLLQDKGR
jgi:hypothetical protein